MKATILYSILFLATTCIFALNEETRLQRKPIDTHGFNRMTNAYENLFNRPLTISNILHIIQQPHKYEEKVVLANLHSLRYVNADDTIHCITQAIYKCISLHPHSYDILLTAANYLLDSGYDKEYGIDLLKTFLYDTNITYFTRVAVSSRLLSFDIPTGYDVMLKGLHSDDVYMRYHAERLLIGYIGYVQRHRHNAGDENIILFTIDGEEINLPKIVSELHHELQHPHITNTIPVYTKQE